LKQLCLKQFLPPEPLTVIAVSNFDPTRRLFRQVGAGFPLSDNPFEVVFARQPEQPFTIALDVIAVKQSQTPLRHDRPEPEFAVDEWQGI